MLRTQDAVLHGNSDSGMTALCEAICLDAVDVAGAGRVSIWFFNAAGDLVCRRLLDTHDARFHEGAVIPRSAAAAYVSAASSGQAATVTTAAPDLPGEGSAAAGAFASRIDLLLLDQGNQPAAVFRSERCAGMADWSERDITILRHLARSLAAAIRCRTAGLQEADLAPEPSVLAPMGSARHGFRWLPPAREPSILVRDNPDAPVFGTLPDLGGAGDIDPDWDD